jgi:hypothetical protein
MSKFNTIQLDLKPIEIDKTDSHVDDEFIPLFYKIFFYYCMEGSIIFIAIQFIFKRNNWSYKSIPAPPVEFYYEEDQIFLEV